MVPSDPVSVGGSLGFSSEPLPLPSSDVDPPEVSPVPGRVGVGLGILPCKFLLRKLFYYDDICNKMNVKSRICSEKNVIFILFFCFILFYFNLIIFLLNIHYEYSKFVSD